MNPPDSVRELHDTRVYALNFIVYEIPPFMEEALPLFKVLVTDLEPEGVEEENLQDFMNEGEVLQ